jgi:hypothetical protein
MILVCAVATGISLVPATMEENPTFDATSSQPRMTPSPVYRQKTRTEEDEL